MSPIKNLLFGMVLLVSGWAQASVIYNEAISGDADWYTPYFLLPALNLTSGVNSIMGSANVYVDAPNGIDDWDSDAFVINIGPGKALAKVEYFNNLPSVTSTTIDLAKFISLTSLNIGPSFGKFIDFYLVDILNGPGQVSLFDAKLPLVGPLALEVTSAGGSAGGFYPFGGSWDYEIRLTVVDVNASALDVYEPATFMLFGLGLVSLKFTRRRANE